MYVGCTCTREGSLLGTCFAKSDAQIEINAGIRERIHEKEYLETETNQNISNVLTIPSETATTSNVLVKSFPYRYHPPNGDTANDSDDNASVDQY